MVLDLKELFINSQTSIIDPSVQIFGSLWQVVFLLAFFVLFEIIGYAIAWVIGMILKSALTKIGLDAEVAKSKFHNSIGKIKASELISEISKWGIFIIFSIAIAQTFSKYAFFPEVFLQIALFLPQILGSIILLLIGLIVADIAAHIVEQVNIKGIKIASLVTKIIILFFIITIALENLGIRGVDSLQNSFYILLSGFTLAFSLALGIGLGLGFKDEAKIILQELFHGKKVNKK